MLFIYVIGVEQCWVWHSGHGRGCGCLSLACHVRKACVRPGGSSKASRQLRRTEPLGLAPMIVSEQGRILQQGLACTSSRLQCLYPKQRRAVPRPCLPGRCQRKAFPGCRRRWPSPRPRGRHQDLAQPTEGAWAPGSSEASAVLLMNHAPAEHTWAGAGGADLENRMQTAAS